MIAKNESFDIEITDMSDEGAGIGKKDGFTWFIKDTVVGDTVEASAMKVKKSYGFARLVRIIKPSAERVGEECPAAKKCGGCQLQALSYEGQLSFKENKVLNNLKRIGGFDLSEGSVKVEPIIGADISETFRYRNKAQFPIGRDKNGNITAGFYAGRTHSIIPCEDCLLGAPENKIILGYVIEWMKKYKVTPYDEVTGKGIMRHLLIRKGFHTGEIMVCPVINADRLPFADEFVKGLSELDFSKGREEKKSETTPRIASVSYSSNKEKTNVIMGKEAICIYGKPYIEDVIRKIGRRNSVSGSLEFEKTEKEENEKGQNRENIRTEAEEKDEGGKEGNKEENKKEKKEVRFRISPLSFYQVNPAQMEKLYATALEYAGLTGNETVWDLYCGTGTISLFLAERAKKVYGVEIIPQAIENARENARINGIENAEFFVGRAEEVLPRMYEESLGKPGACSAEVIVVDPPRKGCDMKCLETIVKIAPERVVYVSCDSSTLARDLKYLCENGYEIKRVRACDMFPMTVHVETVILMTYCGNKKK